VFDENDLEYRAGELAEFVGQAEPDDLQNAPLEPRARWQGAGGSRVALLDYDDVWHSENPKETLLTFLDVCRAGPPARPGT